METFRLFRLRNYWIMKKFVVFLRGINVGGHHKVKMADLKSLLVKAGFDAVQTYIQSGNIVLKSEKSAKNIELEVAQIISGNFGFDIPVMAFEEGVYRHLVLANPLEKRAGFDSKTAHLTFLSEESPDDEGELNGDSYVIRGACIYGACPNGYGRTKLTITYFEKLTGLKATSRNYRTSHKMIELLNA